MGKAAEQVGINIQYCMSLPRHALQALEIPRVTQARVSVDYAIHLDERVPQWNIGVSSMLADAIGAPYKKTAMEPVPYREILIATLSTGPVTPGDAISYINVNRIMRCCSEIGTILKHDRPITMINSMIAD
ncbi:unnamed protein product [Rotaria socialis]|uniref:Uncharacterized protein n=1 Tax=Rotaria socialis TaxID=392032 RepID=A0A821K044_9BILA|nr:unnamed protein product [Rotaria socialis]CAF4727611.1 unnamed protein product [Rotaria socialis]